MVVVTLKDVTKSFGDVTACNSVSLEVQEGELFTLLGPSGCGKTTALRVIAGFYYPDTGSVLFDHNDVTNVPPNKRETGMVFQNYALWPHMTVFDNVAYGLKIRKVSKPEISDRVKKALALAQLEGMESRTPYQLSGGQQQRVALARALVIEPKVLLLDEPLSNLDAKLRVRTRIEITKLQKRLKITTIYVTHDQEEALCISDRIAVMKNGAVQQIGNPRQIYELPFTPFVADFIGVVNLFPGRVERTDPKSSLAVISMRDQLQCLSSFEGELRPGGEVMVVLRPEATRIRGGKTKGHVVNSFPGQVLISTYLGDAVRYEVETELGVLRVDVPNPKGKELFSEGQEVTVSFEAGDARVILGHADAV